VYAVLCAKWKEAVKIKRLKSVRRMWRKDQNDNTTTTCIFDKCEIDMT
jgi:hypothetical protein